LEKNMKTVLPASALALALVAFSLPASAQSTDNGHNSAIKDPHTVNAGGPSRGANSFTEGEARAHIEHSGFSDVSALTKDPDGVWRGTAMKDGHSVSVAVDFKGNVSTGDR
jgi:putative membrane protein